MKKYFQHIAIALGVGLAIFASSVQAQNVTETDHYKVTTYTQEDLSRVWVKVEKAIGTKFIMFVKDKQGHVLFHYGLDRKIAKYQFKINLSEAEAGVYSIEMTDGTTPITKMIRKEKLWPTEPAVSQRVVAMN
ncbi:MAG: hypothetical protein U0Y10_25985 [Spirosomataceae bacterium]